MTTLPQDAYRRSREDRWSWWTALTVASIVSMSGIALAVNQFVVNYLHDQNAHTRTLGGILTMLLGIAGIGLPILLVWKRERFLSLGASSRWLLAVAMPALYVIVMVLCVEASMRSTTLILPRPRLPLAVLSYQPGETQFDFVGRWGGGGGSNDAEVIQGVEHFSSHIEQAYVKGFLPGAPDYPDQKIIAIVGRATALNADTVQIVLDVNARESFRFDVKNLIDVKLTRDGQLIEDSVLPPGTYQVTITGKLKKGD